MNSIDRTTLHACYTHCEDRVTYKLGVKPGWGTDSSTFTQSDCSGFTRWILSKCVEGLDTSYPEGSVQQHDWCEQNGLQAVDVNTAAADQTNQIYQFFLAPSDSPDGIGHTGFFQNSTTYECYGGVGVGSRFAQHLINIGVKYAYLWPSIA